MPGSPAGQAATPQPAAGQAPAAGAVRGRHGPRASDERWALLFLAPTLIGLAVLSVGPILATFLISLTNWDMLTPPQFAGFDNYTNLLSDDRFLRALQNTFFYTAVSVPLGLALALGLALTLNQRIRGIAWIRTMYFLPLVTSSTAIAIVWLWMYSPTGLINHALGIVGISPLRWVALGHHAPGTKKSCHPSRHSSIIFSPYSLRPKSSGPVLLVPKLNLQPAAFAIFTNAAPGSL